MAYASELSVITKAKDLCSYIMTITDKSPKRFRFTLVSRLQNYGLDIIEYLINSNFAHIFCLCTLKIQYLAVIQLSKFRCYAV